MSSSPAFLVTAGTGLLHLGCESAQGFLIGRPLEEKDFLAWWKAQQEEARSSQLQPDMWQPEGSD